MILIRGGRGHDRRETRSSSPRDVPSRALRGDNVLEQRDKIVETEEVAILVVAQLPRASMVDLHAGRHAHRLGEVDHPHARLVGRVDDQQTAADDFVALEEVGRLEESHQHLEARQYCGTCLGSRLEEGAQRLADIVAFLDHVQVLVVHHLLANLCC